MEKPFAGQIIPSRKMQLKKDIRIAASAVARSEHNSVAFCFRHFPLFFLSLSIGMGGRGEEGSEG